MPPHKAPNTTSSKASLIFPFAEPPECGEIQEVAAGILWTRMPLPFRVGHVNIYFIDDGDGWAVLDTGTAGEPTRLIWESLLKGPLAGQRLTRLIVSHSHADHVGLAGWLCARHDMPLLMTLSGYLSCLNFLCDPSVKATKPYLEFYLRLGMTPDMVDAIKAEGRSYPLMVEHLPPTFSRILAGDALTIGGRIFEVLFGDGHAPDQVMLYCPSDNIFLPADQILATRKPNIGVLEIDPDGDPLGLYLSSLRTMMDRIPADAFVLPGHELPFENLHLRCHELARHYDERCARILELCRIAPRSITDMVPMLFTRPLDPSQLRFAFSEVHASVNAMFRRGELKCVQTQRPVCWTATCTG